MIRISRRELLVSAVFCVLALVASNFMFQAMGPQEWGTATERSFFQAVAVAIFVGLTCAFEKERRRDA